MFAGLVDTDPSGAGVVPVLVRSWTASDDLKTFTFRLRKDVTFTDGEPVTADTFVRDWAIVCATGAPAAPLLRLIDGAERCGLDPGMTSLPGVRALAPDRLSVTLSAPFADLPGGVLEPRHVRLSARPGGHARRSAPRSSRTRSAAARSGSRAGCTAPASAWCAPRAR